jgi:hypothetical protein
MTAKPNLVQHVSQTKPDPTKSGLGVYSMRGRICTCGVASLCGLLCSTLSKMCTFDFYSNIPLRLLASSYSLVEVGGGMGRVLFAL